VRLAALVSLATSVATFMPQPAAAEKPPLVPGLSHVPTAVRDLEGMGARYRRLGFALKPGRPHDNGIRNLHMKFRDGTEVELITAAGARDDLAAHYVDFLRRGDGPAFLALHAPSSERLVRALRAAGMDARQGRYGVSFPSDHPLDHIFFGGLNQSPTDRPEHFAHPNTAESLIAVWLVASAEHDGLLASLRLAPRGSVHLPPLRLKARRVPLHIGELLLVPGRGPGRPIAGMTVRVRDLDAARRVLRGAGHDLAPVDMGRAGRSVFLPPDVAGGYWLELRQTGARPAR